MQSLQSPLEKANRSSSSARVRRFGGGTTMLDALRILVYCRRDPQNSKCLLSISVSFLNSRPNILHPLCASDICAPQNFFSLGLPFDANRAAQNSGPRHPRSARTQGCWKPLQKLPKNWAGKKTCRSAAGPSKRLMKKPWPRTRFWKPAKAENSGVLRARPLCG